MTDEIKRTITIRFLANGQFRINDDDCEGNVLPHVYKDTAREAAGRVLQIMKVGPVAPQSYPEVAEIGSVVIQ